MDAARVRELLDTKLNIYHLKERCLYLFIKADEQLLAASESGRTEEDLTVLVVRYRKIRDKWDELNGLYSEIISEGQRGI
jgi:hypothetical protein